MKKCPLVLLFFLSIFFLAFFAACSDSKNERRIAELESEMIGLKKKQSFDSVSHTFLPKPKMIINSFYKIGDTEDQILMIQGTPSAIQDYQIMKVYKYGYSSLTFENGHLKSYNNIDKNLKISVDNGGSANNEETNIKNTSLKFCYVIVRTNEPELKFFMGFPERGIKDEYIASPKLFTYKSSVIEIANFSEDEKYKIMDKFEQQVRNDFTMKNMQLEGHGECKVMGSDCFVFDTYKKASEHRRTN